MMSVHKIADAHLGARPLAPALRHARGARNRPTRAAPCAGDRVVVQDLGKVYETQQGRRRVLDGISFSIGAGEKLAVLGRNGAGKSTLVKLIGAWNSRALAMCTGGFPCPGRSPSPEVSSL